MNEGKRQELFFICVATVTDWVACQGTNLNTPYSMMFINTPMSMGPNLWRGSEARRAEKHYSCLHNSRHETFHFEKKKNVL